MNKIINNFLDAEIDKTADNISSIENRIAEFDVKEGRYLVIGRSHNSIQYYAVRKNQPRIYISKKDWSKLQSYLQNYHDRKILHELKAWHKACVRFRNAALKYDNAYTNISPFIQDNVITINRQVDCDEWESQGLHVTAPNRDYKFKTLRGDFVRSKSEALIADYLSVLGLHYRYEDELVVNGVSYYPDFMIMHPLTGDIYMWEHFGLMDRVNYYEKMCEKLNAYAACGFELGKNMIATFESNEAPLKIETIERYIENFFGLTIKDNISIG